MNFIVHVIEPNIRFDGERLEKPQASEVIDTSWVVGGTLNEKIVDAIFNLTGRRYITWNGRIYLFKDDSYNKTWIDTGWLWRRLE